MRTGYCLQKGDGMLGSCGDESQSVVTGAGGMRHGRVWGIWALLERRPPVDVQKHLEGFYRSVH